MCLPLSVLEECRKEKMRELMNLISISLQDMDATSANFWLAHPDRLADALTEVRHSKAAHDWWSQRVANSEKKRKESNGSD